MRCSNSSSVGSDEDIAKAVKIAKIVLLGKLRFLKLEEV